MQDQEIQEQLNRIWNGWKLSKQLGEGSFGKVFRIEREEFGHVYQSALKVMTIPQSQSEVDSVIDEGMDRESATTYFYSMVQDIVEEFTLMSRLRGNTNIVSYEDHAVVPVEGTIGWNIFIRMELLSTLPDYYRERKTTICDVLKLGVDICQALVVCRKYDIIHRDIKPENIFVSEIGDYKLGDFGIARKLEKTSGNLSMKGTMNYMAPEVFSGLPYNATVDIYSLGLVLYRFLNNNRLPFLPPYPEQLRYSDKEEANAKRMSGVPVPPPCNASGRLAEIVLKACAFKADERYKDAEEMKAALSEVLLEEERKAAGRRQEHPEPSSAAVEAVQRGASAQVSKLRMKSEAAAGDELRQTDPAGTGRLGNATTVDIHMPGMLGQQGENGVRQFSGEAAAGGNRPAQFGSSAYGGNVPKAANGNDRNSVINRPEKKKFPAVPAAAAGIVLLGVLGFSVLRGMGRTEVPDVRNLTLEEAVQKAASDEYGLVLTSSGEEYSDTVEKGRIISQSVEAGVTVKKGDAMTVVVSSGAAAEVPELTGKTREEAKALAEKAGLVYAESGEEYSDTVSADTVISQEQTAGAILEKGSTVSVVVSLGKQMSVVPELSGLTLEEAEQTLQKAGLVCESVQEYSNSVEQGRVIRQETEEGTQLEPDSAVKVVVSLGAAPVQRKPASTGSSQKKSDNDWIIVQ